MIQRNTGGRFSDEKRFPLDTGIAPGFREALQPPATVANGAYFLLLSVVVLVRVFAHPRVMTQTVIGAVCGYLLIGYVVTYGYLVIVFLDLSAIAVGGRSLRAERVSNIGEHLAELFDFSFITLTTVGYRDIVPVCPVARTLVVVEALAGQLYLAAFVARPIGSMSTSVPEERQS